MAADRRVQQLIDEILESDRSPEDVCSACPELLPQVRLALLRLKRMEERVNSLFPPSGAGASEERPVRIRSSADLPKIPGYEVREILGRGGIGIVYKAWHLRLNRPVALKMLLSGAYARPHELERFHREAQAIAALHHPNIVQVYDIGEHDGTAYFTMEFVEGGNLARKLCGVPQPARKAAALLVTLAEAIRAAHAQGIVHRDLKPANVMLTADGTPKLTDFGLAFRMTNEAALTQTGVPLGTPSYMSPEQAGGHVAAIGPATDVYALGAILYELLTGRPPFRAETASETERQVIANEPASPRRLNAKIPHDLETICLKCLRKEPQRRYESAQALIDDLRRFERGDPIAARPVGPLERGLRWMRRRPALATAIVAALLLFSALGGASVWWYHQRAATVRAAVMDVEGELRDAVRSRQQLDFTNAAAALNRAEFRLGNLGPAALHDRLAGEFQNLALVTRLDTIHLDRVRSGLSIEAEFLPPHAASDEQPGDWARAAQEYEQVFREFGLGDYGDDPQPVAARVAASPVRDALVAALDDWAANDIDDTRRQWLVNVLRLADPDPWRNQVRDPQAWQDKAAIEQLAAQAAIDRQPVHLLVSIGIRLWLMDGDDRPFLTRVLLAHPADFWANIAMANALIDQDPMEAIGYYRTALAIRPDVGSVNAELGDLYQKLHRPVEAIHYLQCAIHLNSADAESLLNLGMAFLALNQPQDAIAPLRECARLKPDWAWPYIYLGDAMKAQGRIREAIDEYRAGFRGENGWFELRDRLRDVLFEQGRSAEFRLLWKQLLPARRAQFDYWDGYAELCLFLGEEQDYRSARRDQLKQFRNTDIAYIAGRTGLACLLLPDSEPQVQEAAALVNHALATDRADYAQFQDAYPSFLFARGLAEYRQGRYEAAAIAMEASDLKLLGPIPTIVGAMAQYRLGQKDLARRTLATAVSSHEWQGVLAKDRNGWIAHILGREAVALIASEPTGVPQVQTPATRQ